MSDALPIFPGTWAEWVEQLANRKELQESGAILRQALKFSSVSGLSVESAAAMLSWLGSLVMHTYSRVEWDHGLWHPSGLTISVVETDDVPVDSITSGFIKMVKSLGLDPIQDTVKEGPSGLIARLESSRSAVIRNRADRQMVGRDLLSIATMDTSNMGPAKPEDIGNVRGLIYPSGRSFLSYLYDTPFFNAIDELIQHGSLHIRGKIDRHSLTNMNITAFVPFYQGALANLISEGRTQNNLNVLLRQLVLFWVPPDNKGKRRNHHAGEALKQLKLAAIAGIDNLEALQPDVIRVDRQLHASEPMFDVGVGVRSVNINRTERLARLAIAAAFWRISEGNLQFELLPSDYAVADALLHCHDMGSRIVEIATAKGRTGQDALRMLVSLTASEHSISALAESVAQAADEKRAAEALELLCRFSITTKEGTLQEDIRFVDGDVIRAHRERWKY